MAKLSTYAAAASIADADLFPILQGGVNKLATLAQIKAAAVPADGSITTAKLANIATGTWLGRTAAGTGAVSAITTSSLKAALALTKSDVGLSAVDNTADANKPISSAQAAVNALKVGYVNGEPSGGTDGDTAVHVDKPRVGLMRRRVAGVWERLDNEYTWAARPAALDYPGCTIYITDWNQEFYSDGVNWIPVSPFSPYTRIVDGTNVTNDNGSQKVSLVWAPPTGLFVPGMHVYAQIKSRRSVGAVNIQTGLWIDGTLVGFASSSTSSQSQRVRVHGDVRVANTIRWEGSNMGGGDNLNSSAALVETTMDGAKEFRFGFVYTTTFDSTCQTCIEMAQVTLFPSKVS